AARLLSAGPSPAAVEEASPLVRMLELVLCAVLPLLVVYEATIGQALSGNPPGWHFAIDFHHVWRAGRDVLSGTTPYLSPAALGRRCPLGRDCRRGIGTQLVGDRLRRVQRLPGSAPDALTCGVRDELLRGSAGTVAWRRPYGRVRSHGPCGPRPRAGARSGR